MELKLVSLQLAKMLKELGFKDYHGIYYYNASGIALNDKEYNTYNDIPALKDHCDAPVLELAKAWFREEHNIIVDDKVQIESEYALDAEYIPFVWYKKELWKAWFPNFGYKTYEECLEVGLKEACEILKERRKKKQLCFCGAEWNGISCNSCGFDASEVDIY